jgi:HAMP domain-containing protein
MIGSIREFATTRLRVRTAALFLLGGVLPVLLTGLAAWSKFEGDLVEGIILGHRQLIGQVSSEIETELGWYRSQLERLGRQVNVQSGKPDRIRPELESFLAFSPLFYQVNVYGQTGGLVAAATRGAVLGGGGPAGTLPSYLKQAFELARSEGKTSVLPMTGGDHGQVELCFLAPIPGFVDDRGSQGAVAARMRLHGPEIQGLLERQKSLSKTAYVLLTDPAGLVVARAGSGCPARLRSIRVDASTVPGEKAPAPDGALVEAGAGLVEGRRDLLAASVLPAVGLRIVAGRPYAEVTREMVELLRSIGLYLAAGILLAVLLGFWLSQGLVGPILKLVDGIQRVARGEVAHRLEVERKDELGQAARAFNEMAVQLEKGRLLEELWQTRAGSRDGKR